jgi:hypothetical protein
VNEPPARTVYCLATDEATHLCVPETPSVSCDLRVFVDDTADQITSAGFERVEVSDSVGRRLEWRGLSERAVRTIFVVVGLVLSQHPQEMSVILEGI